ncbi:phosphatidylinositol N-acetylglucosaminyltransferase subunit gpi1 [Actinomortierella ambigua]|uniref:Phosphatidylinositol N-acetylglucosaminyltransferase subunit gpi1 n=1 Tax=Actinomortierella ambigua TaxID=1343610 RepID=A0A9P6QHA4_9FUNG|nr:phosphatidylinositol N-acetylglucosaminyltransferase subunit gpi1 [Actinomortierella ambigua]
MNTPAAISKIFWPAHLCTRHIRTGFIVGWNVRSFTACVATIVSDIDLNPLVSAIDSLTADPLFAATNKICGVNPAVLGVVVVPFADGQSSSMVAESNAKLLQSPSLQQYKQTANLWFTIEIKPTYIPSLMALHCCGFQYINISSEIIFYKQPDPRSLQFLTLDKLVLDISNINASGALFDANTGPVARSKAVPGHSGLSLSTHPRTVTDDMNVTLHQINTSFELEQAAHAKAKKYLRRRTRSRSMSEAVRESAVDLSMRVRSKVAITAWALKPIVQPFITRPLMVVLAVGRLLIEIALYVLNWRLPPWLLNGIAVKDLSTTGQQIDLRLQQVCFWPWQYIMVRKRAWTNTSVTRAQYISFYNSMWLVANDIIIGVALGSFLIGNNKYMAQVLERYVKDYTIDSISAILEWLTNKTEYPAGLKLNPELNPFLGQLFKWLIELWADFIVSLKPMMPMAINLIGLSGAFGATMSLSLISDLLAFTTLHVYWFYMVAAKIFHWQLTILYSLFNLFRGKKRNTLRHRIDSCDYDLDQLLLGTILFTLLTFLFPTIVVYYLTFALSRVTVICLQALMETVLACLNHFPLFAIMLRLKDPDRLPGGLKMEGCPESFFFDRATPLRWVVSSILSVSNPPYPLNSFISHQGGGGGGGGGGARTKQQKKWLAAGGRPRSCSTPARASAVFDSQHRASGMSPSSALAYQGSPSARSSVLQSPNSKGSSGATNNLLIRRSKQSRPTNLPSSSPMAAATASAGGSFSSASISNGSASPPSAPPSSLSFSSLKAGLWSSWKQASFNNRGNSRQSRVPSTPPVSTRLVSNGLMPYEEETIPRTTSYLFMTNLPLPMSAIFFQYTVLWKRLCSHYFSLKVLRGLLSGEAIKTIPRLLYPMLPESRNRFQLQSIKPSVLQFWQFCDEVMNGNER